jgi:hypothetical protein
MWRSLFLAVAISLCILGVECLLINKAVLSKQVPIEAPATSSYDYLDPLLAGPAEPQMTNKVIHPPEWAPWSLLSSGAVVMLYALSLKKGE